MLKRTKIYTIILSVLLITLILSMGVFALEDHSTHYTKSFLSGTYRWQYVNGDINIGYYYEKLGTKDYSSRISNAANSWTSFSYSPFDSIYSTTKANCKLLITSNNYGNVQFMGTTNYQSSPKKIQMNEYFHIYEGYDYNSYESVALHEMGHAHCLGHIECIYEIMYPECIDTLSPYIGDTAGIYDIY